MLKTLGIGFAIMCAALLAFSVYHDAHPETPRTTAAQTRAIDSAFSSCKEWTEVNSKLPVGEFIWIDEIKDAKLPAHHRLLEYDYRSKGAGLLMQTRCEFLDDGSIVSARSSL